MKIENRSALVISALIPVSILPKIIFVGAIVTAEAIFYESDAISTDGNTSVEDSYRNYSTHKDDFGQY